MRHFTYAFFAVTVLLGGTFTVANADDDIYKDDGVVYLVSTELGSSETFKVYRDGNEIEIVHTVLVSGHWVELNDKDYFINNVDRIMFIGDNDDDSLRVADESGLPGQAVEIPVVAWGFGGNDYLYGGAASCRLYGGADLDVLSGTPGDDYLDRGTSTNDIVLGNGGADTFVEWMEYRWDSRAGLWGLEDLGSFYLTDFDASEGDVWKTLIRSKTSTMLIDGPQATLDPIKTANDSKYQLR